MTGLFVITLAFAAGAITIGIFLFILFVLLGIYAIGILSLIKKKEHKVDHMGLEVTEKCGIPHLMMKLVTSPKQLIESGSLTSYNWIIGLLLSMVIIIVLSFVTTFVGNVESNLIAKLIEVWMESWVVIAAMIIIRWFFTKINTLLFMWVGKVEMSTAEGSRIFNIIFLSAYVIRSLLDILSYLFPKYLCFHAEPNSSMDHMPILGWTVFIWVWYIEYLVLKCRYHISSKDSLIKVISMVVAKAGIIASFVGILVGILFGIVQLIAS